MRVEEIDILASLRDVVASHAGEDPMRVALSGIPHAALVATQVKYLQRAARKLPQWAAAGCIIPPLAFEQASSEAVALHRVWSVAQPAAQQRHCERSEAIRHVAPLDCFAPAGTRNDATAIDLTCGLGVDAWALSQRFVRVIAVERDPAVAHLARVNFSLLGAHNIEVVTASAEEFVAAMAAAPNGWQADVPLSADLIYIDADRRGAQGRKLVLLEDCSPNVLALLPRLEGRRVVLKLSPMFDAQQARRLLGGSVEVVSLGGECREVVVSIGSCGGSEPGTVSATVLGFGSVAQQRHCEGETRSNQGKDDMLDCFAPVGARNYTAAYLVAPDAALVKARVARDYFLGRNMHIESDTGFALSAHDPRESPDTQGRTAVPGRLYRVVGIERFDPKALRRDLRREGIRRADVMVRDFPLTAAAVARQIGIAEGGTAILAFTRLGGSLWTMRLETIPAAP